MKTVLSAIALLTSISIQATSPVITNNNVTTQLVNKHEVVQALSDLQKEQSKATTLSINTIRVNLSMDALTPIQIAKTKAKTKPIVLAAADE